MPVIRKQILCPGTFWTKQGPATFTRRDMHTFASTGNAMIREKLSIPIPLEHQDLGPVEDSVLMANSVANNAGWVKSFDVAKDGTLWADLDISYLPDAADDDAITKRLTNTIKFVSPRIDPEFIDYRGRPWSGITHVALTPIPVWADQRPFGSTQMSRAEERKACRSATWVNRANRGKLQLSLADLWYTGPDVGRSIDWDESYWDFAAAHAPKGGVTINGKFYPGGRFIPSSEVEKASEADRAKIEGVSEARRQKLQSSTPDHDALRHWSKRHDTTELADHHIKQARRTWNGIRNFHGDLAVHRVQQLMHADAKKLNGAEGGERKRLQRRMALYGHMLDWHKESEAKKAKDFKASKQGVHNVGIDDLHVDPERFQYKLGTGSAGIKSGDESALAGVKKFNPYFAGVVLVWHDQADGKDYIVNGHHRHHLAKRAGQKAMNVLYLDNEDAPTAADARKVGALANISEGRGTGVDAAKLIREHAFTPEDFKAEGVSLKGKVASDAFVMSKLNDGLFRKLTLGQLPEKHALAIGRVDNHDAQQKLSNLLDKLTANGTDIPDKVLAEMATEVQERSATVKGDSGGMLPGMGGDDEQSTFLQRNVLKSHIKNKFASEQNLFKAVGTEKRAGKLAEQAENVLDVEKNKKIADAAKENKAVFDQLINSKGPLSDAVNEAAEELFNAPRKRKEIEARLLERVKGILAKESGGDEAAAIAGQTPAAREGVEGTARGKPIEHGKKLNVGDQVSSTYTVPGKGTIAFTGKVAGFRKDEAVTNQPGYGEYTLKLDKPTPDGRTSLLVTASPDGKVFDNKFYGDDGKPEFHKVAMSRVDMARRKATEGKGGLFEWQPYTGERGGQGWQSSLTGKVKYQKDRPGSHEHEGESEPEPSQETGSEQEYPVDVPKALGTKGDRYKKSFDRGTSWARDQIGDQVHGSTAEEANKLWDFKQRATNKAREAALVKNLDKRAFWQGAAQQIANAAEHVMDKAMANRPAEPPKPSKFQQKINEAKTQELASYGATSASADPRNLRSFDITPHRTVRKALREKVQQHSNPFKRLTIGDLYKQAKVIQPDLTVNQIHGILAKMQDAGEVRLSPYSMAVATHESPDLLMPLDREKKWYVEKPGANFSRNLTKGKNNPYSQQRKQKYALNFSHGANSMADDNDLFDDEDVTGEVDDTDVDVSDESDAVSEPDESSPDDELMKKVADALSNHNLVVEPEGKNIRDFLEHLVTSLNTSHAHTNGDDDMGDMDAGADDMGDMGAGEGDSMQEPQYLAMSQLIKAQDKKINWLLSRAKKEEQRTLLSRINVLARNGLITKEDAAKYRGVVKKQDVVSLSTNGKDHKDVENLKVALTVLEKNAPRSLLLGEQIHMSRSANEVDLPNGSWNRIPTEKETNAAADELVGPRKK